MYILGINAYHGDAAAALIKDGAIIAAVEEERFNRIKHCAGFPKESIRYCLETAGISIEDVEHVGISRDPSAHLHKKVLFAATRAAKSLSGFNRYKAGPGEKAGRGILAAVSERLANASRVRDLKEELAMALGVSKTRLRAQFHSIEHHRAHLASSFFVSPFRQAPALDRRLRIRLSDVGPEQWEFHIRPRSGGVSTLHRHSLHRHYPVHRLSALRR
jgi:carbamoyltransferase